MIKKLTIIFVLLALTGCMPYLKQDFKSYSFNGKEVTLGMNMTNVREIAGTPTKITISEPVADFRSNTMFANDAALYAYLIRTQPYRKYWQYGSFENGDKEQMKITFANGIVTKIQKFTKK